MRALPGRTGQEVLVPELQPGQAHAVRADEPEHLPCERPGRVRTSRRVEEPDAGQTELGDAFGHRAIDLSREVDERTAGRHRVRERGAVDVQQWGELGCGAPRV